jgi:hypothetical protein
MGGRDETDGVEGVGRGGGAHVMYMFKANSMPPTALCSAPRALPCAQPHVPCPNSSNREGAHQLPAGTSTQPRISTVTPSRPRCVRFCMQYEVGYLRATGANFGICGVEHRRMTWRNFSFTQGGITTGNPATEPTGLCLLPQPIARQQGRCTHRNAAALGLVAGVLLHPAVGHLLVCRDKREWGTGDVVSENEWLNACAAPRCVPSRRYHIANHMSPQSQIQHLLPHSNSRKKCRLPFHTPYSCEELNLPAPAGLYSGPDTS